MIVWFDVPGDPVGKARPRFARVGNGVRSYTPSKTANYEQAVAVIAKAAMRGAGPMDGPIRATIEFGMPIPKSWPQKKRNSAAMGDIWPTTKPDTDNVSKAILDACNGITYNDDSQIVVLTAIKRYAIEPGASVRFEVISHDQ
jgi:Holliday junction resolvase RusA-like endonuclease